MALKATIYKVELQIADMDRNYYADHSLTLARHPSETEERLMLRLLAFALHADETMAFGKGISSDEEPDLWQKDLTGAIQCWIDLGQPDEKLVRSAAGRAAEVIIYTYGGRSAEIWWGQAAAKLDKIDHLSVIHVTPASTQALGRLAARNMQLQCTIQDQQIWIGDGSSESVPIELVPFKLAKGSRHA